MMLPILISLIEEELHLLEKLHPVLLQHNEMRSLADLDEPLVRATWKLVEERLCTLAGSQPIPFGDNHQRRSLDPLRVVVCLARVPVIAVVLEHARWAAQHGWL